MRESNVTSSSAYMKGHLNFSKKGGTSMGASALKSNLSSAS